MDAQLKERVYDLMVGAYDLEHYPVAESQYVANEFEQGKLIDKAYEEVFNANCRICERLGVEEDNDVELIINSLLDICKYLSIKMFDYGIFFSTPSIK